MRRSATLPHRHPVGIRALQPPASPVVARAAAGERIVITDRGRPAALLVPVPGGALERVLAAGLAHPPARLLADLAPPAPALPDEGSLSDELARMRADERP